MTPTLAAPLAPFADAVPVPQRLVAAEQNGELSVPIRAGAHRFHRDLPESAGRMWIVLRPCFRRFELVWA